jgi:ADP-ribose pyrophosphatase YjhB (NUDIX family)
MSDERFNPYFSVFIIFRDGNKVLLSKRANTAHEDGNYSMVSGHVDAGESFIEAAMRESEEEAGVKFEAQNLKLEYILHFTRPDRTYISTFLSVDTWQGEITNKEPEKCDDLAWFDIDNLPENTVDYVRFVIQEIQKGKNFGTWGF